MAIRGIASVGIGEPYKLALDRLRESLAIHDFRTVLGVIEGEGERPYSGYRAKPFALRCLRELKQVEIGLLLDAPFVAIKSLDPLFEHIEEHGYYLSPSGFSVGQFTSDEMLEHYRLTRDETMDWPQCASGCVGLDFRREECRRLLRYWCEARPYFAGFHSNINAGDKRYSYRNEGWVSDDPRCLGHRHDQSALAIIAYLEHFHELTPWTKPGLDAGFVAYGRADVTERSVLVLEGL